ncbi:NupC/NupG family nucleoside CNT transporter [Pediococcus acidilactici]|jgi:CNT family concentrative nucleoside transporter/purine nucleoside transport protein|uniref:NupC/NupG family nucleoside CNT transporter n=1 Tax=Pediococcus acidilactici TaxID=1254 RepID=UPI00140F56CF|nr:nucleoside transporter C-terminal domain-containing protein [Pediococcus acidilactici]MCI1277055.1 NupC/NupG family nucleoside CNT transporter [Pediococcus acidilactici]QIO84640.1 NupC/NupG family nucleoside CNT transporter [Pediococcus acidilactici]QJW86108.1 NupC/NupG family nucleoside CNT transporter [Pediococcus acidilactici]QYI94956.1 NupC/NupG family nucleoside CNT transporter [Pediococcus acidilactici]
MYLIVNIIGLVVFLSLGVLFSKKRQQIKWKSVGIMVVFNLVLAWFLTSFPIGRSIVAGASAGFNQLVQVAYQGIAFALADWVDVKSMNFVTSSLLPILMIIPLFDILTYVGILPWIIKWIGRGLSKLTGQPKFESFFAVEMMFLGNTEALAVSSLQLQQMKAERNLTLAMMSMSCVTASIIGAYTSLMPGQFILTAIPINVINAIIITNMLNPVTVTPEEDTIATMAGSGSSASAQDVGSGSETLAEATVAEDEVPTREPFFSFLGDSILNAGKLVLIITANVIAFVALAALVDKLLGIINPWLTLEHILGIVMFPFAWLTGLNVHDAFEFAQYMGTKLVTNEFVVMGKVTGTINQFAPHYKAVLTVFLTSFANFSTVGMIIGCFKGLVNRQKNDVVAKNVGYLLLSGILVSLVSAATVGLFVW